MQNELKDLYAFLAERYIDKLKNYDWVSKQQETSKEHILFLLREIKNKENFKSIDKLARLFGYIQGILTVHEVISVQEERNFTRPYFQKIYKKHGIEQETI